MKVYNWLLCGLLTLSAVWSCDRMNDLHDQYLEKGAIIYTMKVDSAEVFAGKNRVLLRYYTTDPKAKKLQVYWNLRTESQVFDIPVKNAEEPVDVYIDDLDEGRVHFELFTLNENMQNKSVPYSTEGNVYGSIFQQSLVNRKCAAYRTEPDQKISIEWYSADPKVTGCEIKYTDQSGETVYHTAPAAEAVTIIDDMSAETRYIEYRTMYLPEPDAIDIFYTTGYHRVDIEEEDKNITALVLKNTVYPFIAGVHTVDEYYKAADWIVSANLAPNGNVEGDANGGLLTVITWSGFPVTSAPNAKLYQTVELDAGKYRFLVSDYGAWTNNSSTLVYVAAALGNELPDTNDTERNALAFAPVPFINGWSSNDIDIEFTLSVESVVSTGFVGNLYAPAQVAVRGKIELWKLSSK